MPHTVNQMGQGRPPPWGRPVRAGQAGPTAGASPLGASCELTAVVVREVRQWLAPHQVPQTVVFVAFDDENRRLHERELQAWRS